MSPSLLVAAVLALLASTAGAQDSREIRRVLTDLWNEQRYEELLKTVQPHLAGRPEAAELWMMAAEAALKTEDHSHAIEWFEKSVALSPALRAAAINLGFAYLKADRSDDAEKIFEPFLKDSNKHRAAKAHYGLGLVLSARGDSTKAKEVFEAAAALNPDDVRAPYRLGQLALQAARWDDAVVLFMRVLSKDDLHHGAAYGLARAYAGKGRKDQADQAAEHHRRILEVSDALPGMIRKLADAKDPVAARMAIARRLEEAGADQSAEAWALRAYRLDPTKAAEMRRLRHEPGSRPESRR